MKLFNLFNKFAFKWMNESISRILYLTLPLSVTDDVSRENLKKLCKPKL